jgi:hypothetical protein
VGTASRGASAVDAEVVVEPELAMTGPSLVTSHGPRASRMTFQSICSGALVALGHPDDDAAVVVERCADHEAILGYVRVTTS